MEKERSLEMVDKERIEALNKRKPVEYFKLCVEYGIPEDEVESPILYNNGKAIVDDKFQKEMRIKSKLFNDSDKKEIKNLEDLGEVIKKRVSFLKEIRGKVGFEVVRYVQGAGTNVIRWYDFVNNRVLEDCNYANGLKGSDEIIEDCIKNLKVFVEPCVVKKEEDIEQRVQRVIISSY